MGERTKKHEADLVRREADLLARETALEKRLEAAQSILLAANDRDARADARDDSADQRESDSDREKMLNQAGSGEYGDDWPERRNASLDRAHAKDDRTASQDDRTLLTEGHADDEADPPRTMIIIAGHELVDADKRDRIVEAHRDLVSRARELDGCLHVAIAADSVDPERINSVEVWRDSHAMEEWRGQANAPDTEEANYTSVKRYNATDGGPLV